jgi:hypothetical protein
LLTVPWALDENGRLVTPAQVTSRVGLRCPDPACGSRLSLRAGQVRVHHFAHLDDGRCSYESVQHWAAKHLLATVVRAALSDEGRRPAIHRRCPKCAKQSEQPLPKSVRGVLVEAALDRLRPDVLLLDEAGKPLCAIEVLHTHAVTLEKAERLPIPWLELPAHEVLSDPLVWRPRKDGLRPLTCCHGEEVGDRHPKVKLPAAPQAEPTPKWWAQKREELRRSALEKRFTWCRYPLAPNEFFAEITDAEERWWPMEPWTCASVEEAIQSAERKLRTFRELCLYLQPKSTLRVVIHSWDGSTREGGWLRGAWVVPPSPDGGTGLRLRAERQQSSRRYWRARRRWRL